MIINEHISHLQSMVNHGNPSDDNRLEDEHVYHLMKMYRSRLIHDKQNKFYKLSPFSYQTIACLPLIQEELNDCDCFETGCLVLKSKCDIPKTLSYRNNTILKITSIDGRTIPVTSITKETYKKYRKTSINKFGWFIHNNKLIVVGDLRLKVVTLTGIFEDPLALKDVCSCDDGAISAPCFDPLEDDFPIDIELVPIMYKLILEDLGLMYKYPEDNENNSKSNELSQDKE